MDNTKVSFGMGQISNSTPEWANWIFRGWLIMSNALTGFITTLAAIKGINLTPVEIGIIMASINFLNLVVYGFSKLFGVVPDEVDPGKPFVANQQLDDKGNVNAIPDTVIKAPDDGGKPDIVIKP